MCEHKTIDIVLNRLYCARTAYIVMFQNDRLFVFVFPFTNNLPLLPSYGQGS